MNKVLNSFLFAIVAMVAFAPMQVEAAHGGSVVAVNDNNFSQEVLNSDRPVIVDFHASWCGPCKRFAPTYAAVAGEMGSYKFVSIDIDQAKSTANSYRIRSVPTLVFINNGKEQGRHQGPLNKSDFVKKIQTTLR